MGSGQSLHIGVLLVLIQKLHYKAKQGGLSEIKAIQIGKKKTQI